MLAFFFLSLQENVKGKFSYNVVNITCKCTEQGKEREEEEEKKERKKGGKKEGKRPKNVLPRAHLR